MSEQNAETPKTPTIPVINEIHLNNGSDIDSEKSIISDIDDPVNGVRMRNTNVNGVQATINGHAALQRGLEVLAETESSQNNEEIKKLDTQLDHFNQYLDKFEKKNTELTSRLTNLLNSQKEERQKRRASFLQREEEMKAEQDNFDSQLRCMFAKCAQMRRTGTSAPTVDNGVDDMLENSRKIREGTLKETSIQEINGHEENATVEN